MTHLLEGNADRTSALGRCDIDRNHALVVRVKHQLQTVGTIRTLRYLNGLLPYVRIVFQGDYLLLLTIASNFILTGWSSCCLILLVLISLHAHIGF